MVRKKDLNYNVCENEYLQNHSMTLKTPYKPSFLFLRRWFFLLVERWAMPVYIKSMLFVHIWFVCRSHQPEVLYTRSVQYTVWISMLYPLQYKYWKTKWIYLAFYKKKKWTTWISYNRVEICWQFFKGQLLS